MSGPRLQILFHFGKVLPRGVPEGVAFFGDGEGCHLQGGGGKDFPQPRFLFRRLAQGGKGFHDTSHHRFCQRAVPAQGYQDAEIVIRGEGLPDGCRVCAGDGGHSPVHHARIQQLLYHPGLESPENISASEMNPAGRFSGAGRYRRIIEGGELKTGLNPLLTVCQPL